MLARLSSDSLFIQAIIQDFDAKVKNLTVFVLVVESPCLGRSSGGIVLAGTVRECPRASFRRNLRWGLS